jgi:hypothetical protein
MSCRYLGFINIRARGNTVLKLILAQNGKKSQNFLFINVL